MAKRKKTTKRLKPHYVRTKKRKGADSSALVRRGMTVALLLFLIVGILFGIKKGFDWIGAELFSRNSSFEIQHLVVSSDGRLTEDRIREYIEISEGMNLFEVSFKKIEKKLSGVSEIESVHLERKLPHTLMVTVKERMPVARISGSNTKLPYLLDRNGFVMAPRLSSETLPLIKMLDSEFWAGSKAEYSDVAVALEIIALCDSRGYLRSYARIESLDMNKKYDFIDMRLSGKIRVRMPRHSLNLKLRKLNATLSVARNKGKRVKSADLTVDSPTVPVVYY